MRSTNVSVGVFAYNEERGIIACLDSIFAGGLGRAIDVHVLVNGCTDRTADIVANYAASHSGVHVHVIGLGDKTNAWNLYIHEFCSAARVHIFVDGDVQVRSGSLAIMAQALEDNSSANASTAIPDSGRNSGDWLSLIVDDHGLAGNLYALRGEFVDRIRAAKIKLPVGLIGDDSWIGALANFDLDIDRGWVKERTIVCTEARFHYDSLQWYRPRDIKLYWRRRQRYAHRTWQNQCMKTHIHNGGMQTLPIEVNDLYRTYPHLLRLTWKGVDTLFLWLALRKIRACLVA